MESQRTKDMNYRNAVRNSTPRRLRERAAAARMQRNADAYEARQLQQRASFAGVKARLLWATKNQGRLLRVFA